MDTKDDITKTTKLISLQFFCELFPDRVESGIEFHRCFLIRDPICDEIISDNDVAIPLATWLSAILLQFDDTLIILIDNIVMDLISLIFQEVPGQDHLCQYIVYSENLGLS